ncbi:MAG: hypothetical protein ACYC5M_18675 [Anaerolineae bacterium]
MQNENKNKYAALFMLGGIAIGGGLGVILFATTQNPVFLALAGAGVGIGLSIGAAVDKSRQRS